MLPLPVRLRVVVVELEVFVLRVRGEAVLVSVGVAVRCISVVGVVGVFRLLELRVGVGEVVALLDRVRVVETSACRVSSVLERVRVVVPEEDVLLSLRERVVVPEEDVLLSLRVRVVVPVAVEVLLLRVPLVALLLPVVGGVVILRVVDIVVGLSTVGLSAPGVQVVVGIGAGVEGGRI